MGQVAPRVALGLLLGLLLGLMGASPWLPAATAGTAGPGPAGARAGPDMEARGVAEASPVAEVRDIVVEGHPQRLLLVRPAAPRAVLVMLPGASGRLGIAADGTPRHGGNFLVRARDLFAAAGFAVLVPDAPGPGSLRGRRAGPAYGRTVAALAHYAGAETGLPVFLLGTSQGAIAAVNGAGRLEPAALAGLVLMEAVSRRGASGETVFDADPAAVRVPTLILANDEDACPVAPPADAPVLAARLAEAPQVEVVRLSGGRAGGRPCGARGAHGYLGMEDEVVARIAAFIDARLAELKR